MVESFPIAPAGSRSLWFFIPIAIIMLGAAAMLLMTALGPTRARIELSPAGLALRGDIYGRRLIPATSLRGGAARIVDLDREPELAPRWRTMGTGLPGYRAGWFRLRNGEKALLSLTDVHRAVYVPTGQGFALLLSPAQPDGFLAALRRVAPGN
jgi:Bacterial PH domain